MNHFGFGNSTASPPGAQALPTRQAPGKPWRDGPLQAVAGQVLQKVVRKPTSMLRPWAGAMSRRIELA